MKCLFTSIIAVPINATFFVYATSVEHYTAQFTRYMTRTTETQLLRQPALSSYDVYNHDILYDELSERFQNRFSNVVYASWIWWFPFNFVNWYYVPLNMRMVFSSFAAVGWNCFLSLVQHKQPAHYHTQTIENNNDPNEQHSSQNSDYIK